jgi:DNA-binding MarR family transcriptional regulator
MSLLHDESSPPSPPAGAVLALERLFELAAVLDEFMERGLSERGLTRARARVIWQLYHHGSVTQRELAQALGVTPRNVTGLIDVLADDGFVARGAHPTDRRATIVALTEQGNSVAAALHAEEQAFARMMFEDVADGELSDFVATLDRVLEWLRGPGPTAPDVPS